MKEPLASYIEALWARHAFTPPTQTFVHFQKFQFLKDCFLSASGTLFKSLTGA